MYHIRGYAILNNFDYTIMPHFIIFAIQLYKPTRPKQLSFRYDSGRRKIVYFCLTRATLSLIFVNRIPKCGSVRYE